MKLKYPKFIILILTYIIAFLLLSLGKSFSAGDFLSSWGYGGTLLGGLFYAYGFTSGPAMALLIFMSKTQNIFWAAIVAGTGSLIADLLIFRFFRRSLKDEIERLSHERFFRWLDRIIPKKIKKTLSVILAAIIISSPLPDEIGVFVLSVNAKISNRYFMVFSYTLNTIGILIILFLAN